MNKDPVYNKTIEDLIDSNRIVQILSELIARRSDTKDDMEYETAIYLKSFLEDLGAKVELQHVELKRYNVIARFRGAAGRKTLMYSGHIDVVPPGNEDNWRSPPFTAYIEKGKLYGRGSADMKGSIACILHVMEILTSLKARMDEDVLMVLDVDEEITNKGLRKFFTSGMNADACLVGEPTEMQAALGHKGVLGLWLTFKGRRVHSARPELGINPIMHAMLFARKLEEFQSGVLDYRCSDLMGHPTMTITMINAGKELNCIPQQCDMRVDRRLIAGETRESCLKELDELLAVLKREIKDFNCQYKVTTFCPPGETSPDDSLVKYLQQAIDPANPASVPLTAMGGTCEASLIAENMGIPVVICGPGRMQEAHTENEYVSIEQLQLASKVYARLILGYH